MDEPTNDYTKDLDTSNEAQQKLSDDMSLELESITNQQSKKNDHGVHTYASDVASFVKVQNPSMVSIAVAEQQKKDADAKTIKKEVTVNYVYAFLTVVFCVGAIVLFVVFTNKKESISIVPTIMQPEAPVFKMLVAEERVAHVLPRVTRQEMIVAFKDILERERPLGTVLEVVFLSPEKKIVPVRSLLQSLSPYVPSIVTSFVTGPYAIVAVPTPEGTQPVVLMSVDPLSDVSRGMVDWEKTLLEDWASVLGMSVPDVEQNLFITPFESAVIANKDVRQLATKDGTTVLLYAELRSNLLAITPSETALIEVFRRVNLESLQ